MKTKSDYLNYVHAVLDSIPSDQTVKACYDTGYGLHLVDEDLGHSPMSLFVIGHSVAKIKVPEISCANGFKEWDEAWDKARELVNKFITNRN